MKWIAVVYTQGQKFYVQVNLALTQDAVLAYPYGSREQALDAATDASFENEEIDAIPVSE